MIELNITSNVVLYTFLVGLSFLVWAFHNYGKSLKDLDEAQKILAQQIKILDQQMKTNEETQIRLANAKVMQEAAQKKYKDAIKLLEDAKILHQTGPYL